jgi:hypothetical protein
MVSTIFLAQSSGSKTTKTNKVSPVIHESQSLPLPLLLFAGGGMVLVLVAVIAYGRILLQRGDKKLKFEQFRTRELEKKLKLALETIRKMETNPDLVHSREFNLDYLRMRMSEEVFHFAIVNQIKIKVKDKISLSLRPSQATKDL